MSCLTTDLKIFEFEDGETHWIVAKTKEDAIKWYETEYADKDVLEEGYAVKETLEDSKVMVSILEDDRLLTIVNMYKPNKKRIEHISIWLLLKYALLECELQDREYTLPNLIASTVY